MQDHSGVAVLPLGDAFYATYFLLCSLRERGVDGVFEPHGSRQRTTDFNQGQHLGPRDHLIVLPKPALKPDWMSQADFDQAPKTLTVRELHTGGKTLVTTLLCPKQTDKAALRALYRDRWHVELVQCKFGSPGHPMRTTAHLIVTASYSS